MTEQDFTAEQIEWAAECMHKETWPTHTMHPGEVEPFKRSALHALRHGYTPPPKPRLPSWPFPVTAEETMQLEAGRLYSSDSFAEAIEKIRTPKPMSVREELARLMAARWLHDSEDAWDCRYTEVAKTAWIRSADALLSRFDIRRKEE